MIRSKTAVSALLACRCNQPTQMLLSRALRASAAAGRRGMATYSERMDKTGRPISPHVTIYAFPTIAITSVMVRITGFALTVGARRHRAGAAARAPVSSAVPT
jgi:hypothetical protein